MIRVPALVALLLLAPATPVSVNAVRAASFDCAKATTSFEKAICADPEASRQDEILAQAYATALGGLSKPAMAEVTAAQKSWLSYAERACSDDAEPIKTAYTDDQLKCLGATFRSRITDLEASRMLGGYRFYPINRYLVQNDSEADVGSFHKLADKQYKGIKVDRADDTATAFNKMMDDIAVEQGNFFEPGTTNIATDDETSDYDVNVKVTEVTDRRISLQTNQYWYGHGAAHGNYFIVNQHFLVNEKRRLVPTDIFEGDWQKVIGDLTLAAIKEKLGEDYFASSDDDAKAIATDPLRWSFSEDGLIVQFNIYEVTAYAIGAPTVTIPWDELRGITTDDADNIAGFY